MAKAEDPGMDAARQRAVDQLIDEFSGSDIPVEELEQRMDRVLRARSAEELAAVFQDEPGQAVARPPTPARTRFQVTASESAPGRQLVWGFLGNRVRQGAWTVAGRTSAVCFLGALTLDFRDAVLGPGRTTVAVVCKFGSVELIVPPDLPVEVQGFGVLGAFDYPTDLTVPTDPERPSLLIDGFCTLGAVRVVVRGREAA